MSVVLAAAVGLGSLMVAVPAAQADTLPPPTWLGEYGVSGQRGNSDVLLSSPAGVAYDSQERLWVADPHNDRVVRFGPDHKVDKTIQNAGPAIGVAIDSQDNVWVATTPSPHQAEPVVKKYGPDGLFIRTLPGQFSSIGTVSIVGDDDVAVLDHSGRISRYEEDGTFVRSFSAGAVYTLAGTRNGEILAWGRNADDNGYEVRRYSEAGDLQGTFAALAQSTWPVGLAADPNGTVWVGTGTTVQQFTSGGSLLQTFGSKGRGKYQFGAFIKGIAVSADDRLAVSDNNNNRVHEYTLRPVFEGFAPRITGSSRVADELGVAGVTGATPAPSSEPTYSWTVAGSSTPRSTTSTFTPTAADLGKVVTVAVTLEGDGTRDTPAETTRTATTTVLPAQFADFTPTISGTGVVGDVLTADPGTITPSPSDVTYAWRVGDDPTARSATAQFTPVAADKGKVVTVTVTAKGSGGTPEDKARTATRDIVGRSFAEFTPTYTGDPVVGGILTAVTPTGLPEGTTVTSQFQTRADGAVEWTDVGTTVGGTATFAPRAADLRTSVRLRQTLREASHTDKTADSASTTIAKGTLTPRTPTITGIAKVGQTLTATVGTLPDGVTVGAWAWGTTAGSTCTTDPTLAADTVVVPAAWAGDQACVVATTTATGYEDSTEASTPYGPVVAADAAAPPAPVVDDTTPVLGQRLRASQPSLAGTDSAGLTYTWGRRSRNGTCAATATGDTYTPTVADLGRDLCVVVTTKAVAGYADATSATTFTSRVREAREAKVSDRTVRKGQRITISATDLVPGQRYTIRVFTRTLTGVVPANGRVSRTWTYPRRVATKVRTIRVSQDSTEGRYDELIRLRYTARR